MRVTKDGRVQRICASDKDIRQAQKREFAAKGLDLVKQLRKELQQARKGGSSG